MIIPLLHDRITHYETQLALLDADPRPIASQLALTVRAKRQEAEDILSQITHYARTTSNTLVLTLEGD